MNKVSSQAKNDFRLNINNTTAAINCLVTGFDPFENHTFNPSEAIVNTSPELLTLPSKKVKINLNKLVLPTCGEKAWPILKTKLNKMMANKKPCVIVMFGLAASRKNVNLERFALNIRDGDRKDNYGHVYNGQIIDVTAPQALKTDAPIEKALLELRQKGLPADISNFCNTYVCNEIYFRVLRHFENAKIKSCISFVHIPMPRAYGKTLLENGNKNTIHLARGKNKQLEAMQLVGTTLVEFYAELFYQD